MAYELHTLENVLHVHFYDSVSTADLLSFHENKDFLESLSKLGKVIFDYSDVTSMQMTFHDTGVLGMVAKSQAILSEEFHKVIVLKDPSNRDQAEVYQQKVAGSPLRVDIANDLEEALHILTHASSTTND